MKNTQPGRRSGWGTSRTEHQQRRGNGDNITYTYDATGRKLTQVVILTGHSWHKTTEYDGEFIYQGDTLQFINHEEGRIVMTGASPDYQYHLKDHLGNVRSTFTSRPYTVANIATFETANRTSEASQFLRYDDTRLVNSTMFDHTHLTTPAVVGVPGVATVGVLHQPSQSNFPNQNSNTKSQNVYIFELDGLIFFSHLDN